MAKVPFSNRIYIYKWPMFHCYIIRFSSSRRALNRVPPCKLFNSCWLFYYVTFQFGKVFFKKMAEKKPSGFIEIYQARDVADPSYMIISEASSSSEAPNGWFFIPDMSPFTGKRVGHPIFRYDLIEILKERTCSRSGIQKKTPHVFLHG